MMTQFFGRGARALRRQLAGNVSTSYARPSVCMRSARAISTDNRKTGWAAAFLQQSLHQLFGSAKLLHPRRFKRFEPSFANGKQASTPADSLPSGFWMLPGTIVPGLRRSGPSRFRRPSFVDGLGFSACWSPSDCASRCAAGLGKRGSAELLGGPPANLLVLSVAAALPASSASAAIGRVCCPLTAPLAARLSIPQPFLGGSI